MSNNFTKAEPIDFNKARLVSTYQDVSKRFVEPQDIYTRLARRLQTTLDIRMVIQIFMEHLQEYVPYDHFEYYAESCGIHFGSSRKAVHSCDYHLALPQEDLGNLRLTRSRKFSEEELALIENLLSALVYPLRNSLLYKQAIDSALTDSLTGIGNKRALDVQLHREAEIAKRHHHDLSIIVIDVDKFKRINDQHGHSTGDDILHHVVKTIESVCRKSDLLFRFGGEEFVVILRETDLVGAYTIAERIRNEVEGTRAFHGQHEIPVTISLGVATFEKTETLANLFDRADKALFRAKNSGRNKTCTDAVNPPEFTESKAAEA